MQHYGTWWVFVEMKEEADNVDLVEECVKWQWEDAAGWGFWRWHVDEDDEQRGGWIWRSTRVLEPGIVEGDWRVCEADPWRWQEWRILGHLDAGRGRWVLRFPATEDEAWAALDD